MIGVVVPVHNEVALLGDCLDAIATAARDPALENEPVEIVAVLDACTDASPAVAVRRGAQIVSLDARCVGAARALGASYALDAGARWLAFTDADCVVPRNWLSAQLAAGADVACGPVRIDDWSAHPFGMRERFLEHYERAGAFHVHAANLGLSATAYRRSGGFPPVRRGEAEIVVASLARLGLHVAWNAAPAVTTSARWESTIEPGFASLLREMRESCLAELSGAATAAA